MSEQMNLNMNLDENLIINEKDISGNSPKNKYICYKYIYMFTKIRNILFEPRIALVIFCIFIIGYLIVLDYEGAFNKKFLNFGPSKDSKFLNMKLDTWTKVILVYIMGFALSILTSYYQTVMFDFIHSKIWNPAYTKTIGMSKSWATAILLMEPLLYWILSIIQFFVTLTMELQFLVPQFIGKAMVDIPYAFMKISENRFI
tara:strand:- start:1645 stop:2247 length:603 start_codon:yes stop_codon:yes gene_type:complete